MTVFSSKRSPGSVRRAVLENSRKFQRKNRWQCIFLKKLANKTPHKGWFPGIFLKYFRSAISKNTWWLLLRLSGKAVVTFLFYEVVARNWQITVLKNVKKLPGKHLQRCIFQFYVTKNTPHERFPGKFFERLSAEIHWEGCHFVKTWDVLQCWLKRLKV